MKTLSLVAVVLSLAALLLTSPATVDARRATTPTPTATWVCPAGEYWQPVMHRCWIDPTAGPTLAPALIAVTAPAPGYPGPAPVATWGYPGP